MDTTALEPSTDARRAQAVALVQKHFATSAEVKLRTGSACAEAIAAAATLVADAMRNGRKLMICGNGGSAGDSQHLAAEFVSVLTQTNPRRALPAMALTTDTSVLTARGNDFGFREVFSRQIEALGKPGDVLLAISTSGNSENVVAAARTARGAGLSTVALTGQSAGALAPHATIAIQVPSADVQHIQEAHIATCHLLCRLVEISLFE